MNIAKKTFLIACCGWLLGGCASIKYQQHHDDSVDFTSFKTYSWHPDGRGDLKGSDKPADITRAIEDAVDEALAKRRYIYQPKSPDFLVRFYGAIKTQTDVREVNATYRRDPGIGWSVGSNKEGRWGVLDPDVELEVYDEGTLFLDIHSAKDGKLVWRGKAIAVIRTDLTNSERKKMVREAVEGLIDRFPPKKD